MHATAFLKRGGKDGVAECVVLHGGEAHLKQAAASAMLVRLVLGEGDEQDLGFTRFTGREADWKGVRDELQTVSMFGDRRLVVVEEADDFISAHREALEAYVDKPARKAVLVLDVKSWRKNTRLAKKVAESGLDVDCGELTGAVLTTWLSDEIRVEHGKQLTRDAAALLVELAGTGLTLLSQELAKLSAYAGDREKLTVEDVRALVGGWKAETTWKMTDAVRDGRPAAALLALHKLLTAGEAAPKILGGINYVFRKPARAAEFSRQGVSLRGALQQAGVFPRDVEATERYLRRLGRPRAERIMSWLLDADAGLKGGSRLSERLQLEQLLLRLSGALPA